MHWVIGIDEVGRGPLAGPIAVGAVAILLSENEWSCWEGLKDSKKLSEKRREAWYALMDERKINRAVSMVSAATIDKVGIAHAAKSAAAHAIARLNLTPNIARVLLDHGLKVPAEWEQEQFVKGDERFPAIALASIFAKVTRDRYMVSLAEKFPAYGFDQHKGYGTAHHYAALKKHGPTPLHRRTFLG